MERSARKIQRIWFRYKLHEVTIDCLDTLFEEILKSMVITLQRKFRKKRLYRLAKAAADAELRMEERCEREECHERRRTTFPSEPSITEIKIS